MASIRPWSRCLKRIGGIQCAQKYSRISTWTQHIPIHNLLPVEKNVRKREQAESLSHSYSYWEEYERTRSSFKAEKWPGSQENHYRWRLIWQIQCKRHWIDKDESPQSTLKTSFMEEKLCCVYGVITTVLFWVFKPQSDTQCKLTLSTAAMRAWKSFKNALHSSIGETLCSTFSKTHRGKNIRSGWSILPHPLYSLEVASSDFHLFPFLQNTENDRRFSKEDEVCGKLLKLNQLNFTWEESTSY